MFKRVADEQEAISRGMAEVEELVGLRGRKYYGAFALDGDEYRVCVQLQQGDDPDSLGLEVGTLPGGRYARVRLVGEPPDVYDIIGSTFEALAERADRDPSRPGIEFYRRRNVIDLLLPVD
jgi:GyrI-like small molecule binding protein